MPDTYSLEDDAPALRMMIVSGLMLLFIPCVQTFSQLWPWQVTNIQWRFRAAEMLTALLLLSFLGFAIMGAAGRASGQRRFERIVGWATALVTVLLVAAFGLFVPDAIQLKSIVPSRAMDGFIQSCIRVAVVAVVLTAAYGYIATIFIRGQPARAGAAKSGDKASAERIGLIVGR